MEDDFRLILSVKNKCEGSEGATGLRDLFREDIEELGPPDPDWFARDVGELSSLSIDNQKKALGFDELSSHSSSTTDEDGISSSVRNLLKLLVKRASTLPGRETSCVAEDGLESYDGDKTIGADESWSSSMATPSKNRSLLSENNQSPAIDLNLEINKLGDGDSLIGRLSYSEEEQESPKSDFVFYGFEDPLVDTRGNPHNVERGQNVDHFDRESLCNNCMHSESSFFLNSLISSINKSAQVKLVEAVKTSADELLGRLYFIVPSFFDNSNYGERSKLAVTNIGSGDNLESSQKPGCSHAKQSHLNYLRRSENFDAASISSGQQNIDVSSAVNCIDGVKESRGKMAGNDSDVMTDQVESGNANDLYEFSKQEENTNSLALCELEKCAVESSGTRNAGDEPEYVTQILNLLCSPINSSDSSGGRRKRIGDGTKEKDIMNTHRKEGSEYIVKELLEELVEKSHNRLEEVKVNSLASSHIVFIQENKSQDCAVENRENKSQDKKCVDVIHEFGRVKFEEISHEIMDEEFIRNELKNISFHSEGEQWSNVCSSGENINEGSLSPKFTKRNSSEQNAVAAATCRETSAAAEWNPGIKVSKESLHSPILELNVPTDPQPMLRESVETKLDSENERELNYLGSEDFLSCSVLEEVCQASEALAYLGKVKTDCLMGQESNNGFKSPGVSLNLSREKVEEYRSQMAASYSRKKENMSQGGKIIGACASPWNDVPSTSRNSLPSCNSEKYVYECLAGRGKDLTCVEKRCSNRGEKDRPGKSVKKKIVFNVPECSGLSEFENELNAGEDLYPEVVRDSQGKCEPLLLPVSDNVNISSSEVEKCVEVLSFGGPKRFKYPKQRSQAGPLVPKGVLPEDLMCRAAQLEKYSNFISNSGKSNLSSFKMGNLMSFSSLEPAECDHLSVLESKVIDDEKASIPFEGQLFPGKDKPIKVVEYCDALGEIQANMLEQNRGSGSAEVLVDGTEMLEKNVVVTQRTDVFQVITEEKVTNKKELQLLSAVDESFLSVEACGNEQNMQIIERGEICTSPILTKKFRTKKPFRRRNNQLNVCTPKAKTKLAQGMKKLTPDSVLSEDAVNCIEHIQKKSDLLVEDNSHIVVDEGSDRNNISGMEKLCEYEGKYHKFEFPETNRIVEEKDHLKECDANEVSHLESFSTKGSIGSEFSVAVGDEKDVPSKMFSAKRFCSEDSAPVQSTATECPSASDEKEAISKIMMNDSLFSEYFYPWKVSDDIDPSTDCPVEDNDPAKTQSKANILSAKASTPIRDEFIGFSSASGKKITVSEKSLAHAKKLFANDVKEFEEDEANLPYSEDLTPVRSDIVGFSTVSGKKVAVSESSLNKARKLFSEDMDLQGNCNDIDGSTPSGRKMEMSSKSLLKADQLNSECSTRGKSEFPGFSSASGKKIMVSEKSLAHAQKLFAEDINSLEREEKVVLTTSCRKGTNNLLKPLLKANLLHSVDTTPVSSGAVGFSTASGKKVAVSECSLNKDRELFSEDMDLQRNCNVLDGSTPNGRKMEMSSKSLLKADALNSECSTPGKSEFPGFSSASGNQVMVSEKSLANVKKLFANDVKEFEEDKANLPCSEDLTPVRSDIVGFSTASGKKVAVSESSLNKARKLFSEDMNLKRNYSDLGGSTPSGRKMEMSSKSLSKRDPLPSECSTPGKSEFPGFFSASGNQVMVSVKSLAHAKKLFANDVKEFEEDEANLPSSEDLTPVRSDIVGFSTASGKKMAVSESSLNKARKLFSDDMDLQGNCNDLDGSTPSGGKMEMSSKSLLKADPLNSECSTPGKSDFPGFSSASGKKIMVSEKSLAHAQKLFALDINSSEGEDKAVLSTSSRKGTDNLLKPLLKANLPHSVDTTPVSSGAVGFSTASGKKVAVSESSLNKARKLFSEDMDLQGNCNDLDGSTPSGRKMEMSSKSLLKANPLNSECSTPGKSEFPGFSSASGKKIMVSEKSLAHAQKVFAVDINSSEGEDKSVLTTSCRKGTNNLLKPLLKANLLHSVDTTPVSSGAVGFSTASGKKVAVSESSLNKARKLFSEDMDLQGNCNDLDGSTPSGRKMEMSSKSLLKANPLNSECSTPGKSEFPGFSSASGKKIMVSEKSLAHAQKVFAVDINTSEGEDKSVLTTSSRKGTDNLLKPLLKANLLHSVDTTPVSSGAVGFSTASGKKVAVSESSLNKARKLFSEDMDLQGNCNDLDGSTPSGRKMEMSSKSLLKANPLNSECSTPGKSEFPGFSSASGKKIMVSEKSLAHAQKVFAVDINTSEGEDKSVLTTSCRKGTNNLLKPLLKANLLHSVDTTPVSSGAVGFSTASGKKVAVSESSLNKARKLFSEDMDLQGNCNDLDGSTPSGRKMEMSSKSLLKADQLNSECSTPGKSEFPGFSSASGKKIMVSEKSLSHAKKLFVEEVTSLDGDDNVFFSSVNANEVDASAQSPPSVVVSSAKYSTPVKPEFKGFSSASGKKVIISEKSLLNAKKVFAEDLNVTSGFLEHSHDAHVGACTFHAAEEDEPVSQCLDQKRMKSELLHASESKNSATEINSNNFSSSQKYANSSLIGENELFSNIEFTNCFGKQSDRNSSSNVKSSTDLGFHAPLCRSEASLPRHSVQDIESNCRNKIDEKLKHVATPTCDLFLAESQGDDYIKAVDVATLNSPMVPLVDQNPPSPVFKSLKKGRQKLKRFRIKRKAESGSVTFSASKFDRKNSCSSVNEEFDSKSDSVKSSQSSVVTQEQESSEKGKYSDLWDGDIANESWLGKQLELAEESSLGFKLRQTVDHWAEERKSQREAISSKGNVKPVIGHCLRLRRGMGPQRRSLRDFVKGKRPGRFSKDQLRKFGVLEEVMCITSKNAADFKFKLQDHYKESIRGYGMLVEEGFRLLPDEKGMFGVIEAQSALLAGPGVDPKLLPAGDWCSNHYRWIVWKLAAYEKSFPQDFGGRCLTPENVMCQLKYRWDREIDCGERSALRKIFEKDDTACKRMILCVSDIKEPALPESGKKLELDLMASSSLLELTDGWYRISGIVDSELAHLIKNKYLTIGTKIVTSGAELINGPPNGCSPLEPPASVARIRLFANSTRRARWDAKLGYVCSHPGPLPVSLHSLLPGGGAIGMLNDVILARVYPMLTIEKTLDGRRVVRSKRAEAKAVAKYEFERQAWLESVYVEVNAEMEREMEEEVTARRQKGKRALSDGAAGGKSLKRPRIGHSIYGGSDKSSILSFQGGMVPVEELSRLVDESGDPSEVQKMLTLSQVDMVSAYRQESRENFQKELEERVQQKIRQEEERLMSCEKTQDSNSAHSSAGRKKRDVVSLLKVRLVDATRPIITRSAVFTIWRPSEDVISLFAKEGSVLKIYGISANGMRSNFIQLSSGKHSRYKLKRSQTLMESSYPSLKREILRRGFDDSEFNSLQSSNSPLPPFGEIDLIAMVIRVGEEPNKAKGQGFQYVYLAGSDGSLLSIAFWGGIQEFAVEEFLYRGSIVVVLNLQWRRLHGLHRMATAQAVETSSFTLNPLEERLKKALEEFKLEIEAEKELHLIGTDFIQSCEQKLDAVLGLECTEVSASSCLKESTSGGLKPVPSPMSVLASNDNIGSIRPSIAARMKKLQMYEGSPEISLPTCHLRRSASVIKAFHPPKKCSSTTSSSHERKLVKMAMERCQSPQCHDSEGKTVSVSHSEIKNVHLPDTDSPPMSLDSDPQE